VQAARLRFWEATQTGAAATAAAGRVVAGVVGGDVASYFDSN
jgi:hypothetical protein